MAIGIKLLNEMKTPVREKIIIIGGGGHSKVIISILKKIEEFEIVGYTDNKDQGNLLGVTYLGNDDVLAHFFSKGVKYAAIGIGQIKSSIIRRQIVSKIKSMGFEFPCIISPTAIVNEDVEIIEGTVIMDGVIINTGTRVGSFTIINTKTSIDHDCTIGNYTHLAPGVTLSGGVEIGNNVLIGTGASVIQSRKIVDNVIIAAGSTVTSYILEPGTYIGVPARIMPTNNDYKKK